MEKICPISSKQVNERVVQINAALVIISILFLFASHKWVIGVLSIDFFIRGFLNPSYSFYNTISRTVLHLFKIKPLMVNAGPKIFAAKIGFIFCCMIAASYLFDIPKMHLIVCLIFIFCATLEAMFKFCFACKIYPFIYKNKTSNL